MPAGRINERLCMMDKPATELADEFLNKNRMRNYFAH